MSIQKRVLRLSIISIFCAIFPDYSLAQASDLYIHNQQSQFGFTYQLTNSDSATIASRSLRPGSRTSGTLFEGGNSYYSSTGSAAEKIRRRGWDSFRDASQCSTPQTKLVSCNSIGRNFYLHGKKVDWDSWYTENHPIGTPNMAPVDALPGFTAKQLRGAYSVTGSGSGNKIIAIVDAYYYSNALSDLNKYRSLYGSDSTALKACPNDASGVPIFPTSGMGCFAQINQQGNTNSYPSANSGWNNEAALDLDMATGVCPACSILLIASNSSGLGDLNVAVGAALNFSGVMSISNSYGTSDYSESQLFSGVNDNYAFAAAEGIGVFASTGDSGFAVQTPAAFNSVVGVGGTSLSIDANSKRRTETAWSGAGSGCSGSNAKPAWQNISNSTCANRAVADISAVADPYTGVLVVFNGATGVVGGTSASCPIIASIYAIANSSSAATSAVYAAARIWSSPKSFYDVTSGSNGSCPVASLCNAAVGWDGPTGLGSPNGMLGLVGGQTNVAIPINLDFSGSGSRFNFGSSLIFTSTIAGGEGFITFYYNGKKIFHCSHLPTTNYIATCNWVPTARGPVTITARGESINVNYLPNTSSSLTFNITPRTASR
jgi:subtilase family serine protease